MLKEKLTHREKQIIQKVAEGLTSQQIAEHFNLSIHTVRTHRKNVMKRLNLKRSAQLVYMLYAKP
jgi:DNA-binding CsgD family transcriptional regulator